MSDYIYIDERGKKHNVRIHNFSKDDKKAVRVMGDHTLNPSDRNYPDKKWVAIDELFVPAEFSSEYIKNNTL